MRAYRVEYKAWENGEYKHVDVLAKSVADAYTKAVYDVILKQDGSLPYSAWVASVTYNNGNYKMFNNFEGKPY